MKKLENRKRGMPKKKVLMDQISEFEERKGYTKQKIRILATE